jgi:hypothetical protein
MTKLLGILVFVWLMTMVTQTTQAQPSPVITFDENGNGTFLGANLKWDMLPDPGPGGLSKTLTYLPPFASDFPGDLMILEPTGTGDILSDVVRFNLGGTISPTGTIVFYSDPPESTVELPDLADVGFPTASYTNMARMYEVGTEGNNWVDYTPILGQPGYLPNYPGTTYHIISDVPEPCTLVLLGMGAVGLAFYGWRWQK